MAGLARYGSPPRVWDYGPTEGSGPGGSVPRLRSFAGRGDLRCGYAGIETGRRRRLYLGLTLTSGVTWVASARPRRTGREA